MFGIRGNQGLSQGKLIIHAGDFLAGEGQYDFGLFRLKTKAKPDFGETIPIQNILHIEEADMDTLNRFHAGAVHHNLYGVKGRIISMSLGQSLPLICFTADFKDGRCVLATSYEDIFRQMLTYL